MQTSFYIPPNYFASTQRIASKPAGNADRFNVMQVGDTLNLEELRSKQLAYAQFVADSMELGQLNLAQPGSGIIIIPAVFYFHPDHLGSSTLITDNFGDPYQFFLNLPFGETFAEQRRNGSFDNPYKFNGKELDSETGLYYYGARYYDPRVSNWLSVDPLAESTMTPYQYTYQNPVRYIDPTGMAAKDNDGWGKRGNTWEFSHHITKENYEDLGYSEYLDSGTLYSTTNNVADGRYIYSLNSDGSVINFDGSKMKHKFKTKAGTTIWNLEKDNSVVGFARRAYLSGNHDPKYSPYNPDALSLNLGASGNLYVANYDVSVSLIFSPGNISVGGNAGGGLGIDSNMPFKNFSPFSPNVSLGFHDNYGDNKDVIEGLRAWSQNSTYSGGPFFMNFSSTAIPMTKNGVFIPSSSGTKSTHIGIAPRSTAVGTNIYGSHTWIYNIIKQ